jgi:transposase
MIGVPLGLPGFQILGQALTTEGTLEVTIISNVDRAVCPRCGRVSPKQHDCRQRRKRDVSLGEHRVVLVLCKRRFCCLACGRSFTEPDAICGWRRRTTVRLREEVGKQACSRSITHVAVEQEVGPRFVQTCLESVAQTRLAKQGHTLDEERPLPTPRFLGIDEFARRKGQRYDTLVCDLEGRRVLEVAAGRTHAQVCSVLERLDEPDRVEAVSMDMSLVFREAVRLCLPRARIVADHFHVVQHVGKALGKVVRRAAASQAGRAALKGRSHLFLRPQEPLTPEEESTRSELAAAFPEVHIAWQHKEALRHWYAHATAATAAAELDLWLATVEREGPADLREALAAFRTWRIEILAFFHFLPTRISKGFVEGKNNRTKALMRQAYGYRNRRHLRLRILLGAA